MTKKLIAACMALAAVAAVVLPATASATNDPTLTDTVGDVCVGCKIVPTVETIEIDNTNLTPILACSTGTLTGAVTKNSGGTVEGTISSAKYSGTGAVHADNGLNECTGSFGNAYVTVPNLPLCIRSTPAMVTDEFQIVSGDCNGVENKVKLLIGSTTAGECEYESTSSVKGDYTTGGTQAILTVRNTQAGSGATKIRGGFLCPATIVLETTFTLDTEDGEPIFAS